jgi:hypothetical protein
VETVIAAGPVRAAPPRRWMSVHIVMLTMSNPNATSARWLRAQQITQRLPGFRAVALGYAAHVIGQHRFRDRELAYRARPVPLGAANRELRNAAAHEDVIADLHTAIARVETVRQNPYELSRLTEALTRLATWASAGCQDDGLARHRRGQSRPR